MKWFCVLAVVALAGLLDRVSANCPPGVPIFQCLQDPCSGRTCPTYPRAECRSNYCGGCNYDFFLDGVNVTERCSNTTSEMLCPIPPPGSFGSCSVLCGPTMPCPTGQRCCSNGCGTSCVMPVNVTMCRDRLGRTYNVGETFMKDCNTCTCQSDGSISCTSLPCNIVAVCPPTSSSDGGFGSCLAECMDDSSCTNSHKCCGSCPRQCVEPVRACNVSGMIYHINQTFMAADGCNNCTCTSTGLVLCTRRACIDPCHDEPDINPGDCLLPQPPRYYYDTRSGICRNYTRGCDADSRNDFASAAECYKRCRPSSVCNAPVYPGGTRPPCDLVEKRYTFFGYEGTCNNISYAACGEDAKDYNVFTTYRECYNTCIGPDVTVPNPPTTPDCSEGLVRCLLNPCSNRICPNFPNATCNASYCGRCSAHFFLNGQNVTDMCRNATPTCPDGSPIVRCASNPCDSATCTSQPGARCIPDYCGRCGYRFVNANRHDITRLCGQTLPLPVRQPICPNVNTSLASICANACSSDTDCREGQLCCATSCGRSCMTASLVPYYPVPRTCPASTLSGLIGNCSAVRKCLNNTDCRYNEACCSSECGRVCKEISHEYSCSGVIDEIRGSGVTPPPGYYLPQCNNSTGRFSATQCFVDGTCWCVNVNTGRPLSSFYPRSSRPNCQSCTYHGTQYAVGDTFRSIDGCNQCACTENDVVCTLRACLDTCSLPPETGNCRAAIPAYFFNRTSRRCEKFTYGGCGGNSNRFQTISDCLNRCDNRSRCLQRRDSGPCEALSYQFFFNQTSERCEVFNYGGCQGNMNRFPSGTECANACNPDASVPSCATVRCAIPACDSNSELVRDDSRCCPYCRRTGCDSSVQFTCSNGTCIDRDRRCDRIRDCSDGGDERDCEEECEFRCGSGECIPRSQVCDRVLDCRDGRDETNCTTRTFTGVVNLTPDLAMECPAVNDTFCVRTRNCEGNRDCSGDTICCDNQCGGRSCITGRSLNCRGIRHKQQQSGLLGAFVPACQDDGSFNRTQCRERYCWCVNVNTGQPTSDGVPLPEFPQCREYTGRNNQTLEIGDTETSLDGCNRCVFTQEGFICSRRRCMNATCTFDGRILNSGANFTDECNICNCSAGVLSCQRKNCVGVTAAQMMKQRFNVSLRMQGDYNKINDKDEFKREVIKTLLEYSTSTGLTQEQIEDIKVKPGSVIVEIILVDSNSTTEGANATVIVSQMEQDFDSGVLIIRYDGQVLEPISGGFTATSVGSDDDGDSQENSGLLGWQIAIIVIGVVIVFAIAIVLAVSITFCVVRNTKRGEDLFAMEEKRPY